MKHQTKPPRPVATGTAARLGYPVRDNGPNNTAARHEPQVAPKRPQPMRGGVARGKVLSAKTFAVFDGQHCAGFIIAHGSRWIARTAAGRVMGAYSTTQAAMAALPTPKVQP